MQINSDFTKEMQLQLLSRRRGNDLPICEEFVDILLLTKNLQRL